LFLELKLPELKLREWTQVTRSAFGSFRARPRLPAARFFLHGRAQSKLGANDVDGSPDFIGRAQQRLERSVSGTTPHFAMDPDPEPPVAATLEKVTNRVAFAAVVCHSRATTRGSGGGSPR